MGQLIVLLSFLFNRSYICNSFILLFGMGKYNFMTDNKVCSSNKMRNNYCTFFHCIGWARICCCWVRFWFRVSPVDANCQNCLRLCLHGECNRQQTSDSRTHWIQIKANANAVSTSGWWYGKVGGKAGGGPWKMQDESANVRYII